MKKLSAATADKVPRGWKRVVQWADEWRLSRPQTFKLLMDAEASNLAERRNFRIQQNCGRVCPTPHYRFKK